MQKLSELVGKPIVSAESGERIGNVSDVLLDSQTQHVVGLIIGGGVFSSEQVLPYADVQTVGRDAVVARSVAGVVGAKEWRQNAVEATRSSTLKHKRVMTTSGRAVGQIHDVLLDDAGTVEGFEVAGSKLGALLHRRSILPQGSDVTIGADAVVVPDDTAIAMEQSK